MIGREFVARTRFDPMHRANLEQQLFDSLPGWLEQLQSADAVDIEAPFEGETHSVRLTREQFALEANPLYTELLMRVHRLRTPGPCDHDRPGRSRGIVARPRGALCRIQRLRRGKQRARRCGRGGMRNRRVPGERKRRFSCCARFPVPRPQLPHGLPGGASSRRVPRMSVGCPSHVLYRGQAIALGPEPLRIGLAPPRDDTASLNVVGASAGVSRLTLFRAAVTDRRSCGRPQSLWHLAQ